MPARELMAGSAAVPATARQAAADEWRELGRVLGEAFQDDPVWVWVCPDERRRRDFLGTAFAHVVRPHVRAGRAWTVDAAEAPAAQRSSGAAVWAAPGQWKTRPLDSIRVALPMLRAIGSHGLVERIGALSAIEAHHPREPHWYLEIIGADPAMRGRGIGSALLTPMIERCDAEGMPAYLESSKEENLAFYHRFGFEVTGELELSRHAPKMWAMWRHPR